ncbi:MAG: hypothetical protein Q4C68_06780 [Moraxella sp.]|nr:hypothetical protein [Moraxella sp.]
MTEKDKKQIRMIEITGGVILILYALCQWVFFPYIAVVKAEKGKFKEACAYVMDREKTKGSYKNIILIDGRYYDDIDIFAISATLPTNKQTIWDNFPIEKKRSYFSTVEPNTCKKVQYVEVYNIFGFKKFYLYDYLNQP